MEWAGMVEEDGVGRDGGGIGLGSLGLNAFLSWAAGHLSLPSSLGLFFFLPMRAPSLPRCC
jgi:hypothetical protein